MADAESIHTEYTCKYNKMPPILLLLILLLHFPTTFSLVPLLQPSVTWSLRMDFTPSSLRTSKGSLSPITTRSFDVVFKPEEGYEPPQGRIVGDGVEGTYLLSEDPEDRKDGLWVWGLFKDPLYPFCLVKLQVEKKEIPGVDDDEFIPPMTVYAKVPHAMEKNEDNVREVKLSPSPLCVRVGEKFNADPIGLAKVEIQEEKEIGKVTFFQPRPS
mmetsp:Transcript_1901/g.3799  ORF Transcript_1901/g.3799 Transcript_1901/m.3799 type:complete len:214 (-) Transcript_1901:29-670(-)|eukprot:CAMPEP_0118642168 /NCGR_PEP_ID=MMETSP0785-20121206/5695_1 /TAXON_ID=91992 /ORGANISM="Bolidomonas pacifica, Strain CCMP 1866" /LENGTH=213 /DNA_ID=CAMNT_0006533709 /DNA_START=194 /DNA_END=835 /DNA_ORIENTATION=-